MNTEVDNYVDEVDDLKADKLTENDWRDLDDLLELLDLFDMLMKLREQCGVCMDH